ncbi:GD10032 [Drosophila simulans]|uniref:GD10032 n=1 Tax=Drosophila simulans TaxID=7240 RepID=B4QHV1_DROSI|nr:GD10032 [Drosophila simulans]
MRFQYTLLTHGIHFGDGKTFPIRHMEEDTESLLGYHSDTRIELEEDYLPEPRFQDSIP